jgi:hypothetical protein
METTATKTQKTIATAVSSPECCMGDPLKMASSDDKMRQGGYLDAFMQRTCNKWCVPASQGG